jgi:hypothetical protein
MVYVYARKIITFHRLWSYLKRVFNSPRGNEVRAKSVIVQWNQSSEEEGPSRAKYVAETKREIDVIVPLHCGRKKWSIDDSIVPTGAIKKAWLCLCTLICWFGKKRLGEDRILRDGRVSHLLT